MGDDALASCAVVMVMVLCETCAFVVQNSATKLSPKKLEPPTELSTSELPVIIRSLPKSVVVGVVPQSPACVVLMAAPGPVRFTKALLAIITLFAVFAQSSTA